MDLISELIKILFFALQVYFIFYTVYMLISIPGALIFKMRFRKPEQAKTNRKIAVMLPAYKPNAMFLNVIDAIQNQKYDSKKYDIFVLAQKCEKSVLEEIKKRRTVVFEKSFENSPGNPYLFALNFFIDRIEEYAISQNSKYDAILLVDKDNLLEPDYLELINQRFDQGHVAVQGRRRPINLDTNAACLDYLSENMNDQMLRATKAAFGLSAEISGSGMAFDFDLYKRAISTVDFQSPVHDKTFLLELIKLKTHVFYEPNAILYEEKTEDYGAISNQRTRWLGGQIYLFRKNFFRLIGLGMKQIRIDPVDYAFTLFKIPRALHVPGLFLWGILSLVLPAYSLLNYFQWFVLLFLYFFTILFHMVIDRAPLSVYKALFSSPLFILSIARSAFKSIFGKIQGKFIHTRHTKTISLDDLKSKNK